MPLKINFYCDEKYLNRVPEPTKSSKYFPKWYSELPLIDKKFKYTVNPNNPGELGHPQLNVKGCMGIQDFLNTGYIIPSWADFIFREDQDGDLYLNWMENCYEQVQYISHPMEQFFTMPNKPIYGHFGKIFTPWTIKTDPGVSCLITHPVWHRNKSFTTSTAILHTDMSPFKIPWFFEWNYKIQNKMSAESDDLKDQIISKGEPIVLIIPFYRKKYESKVKYISAEKLNDMEQSQLHLTHTSIDGKYCPYKSFKKSLGKLFN